MARRVPDPAQTHVNAHRPLKYHHAVFETVAKARYCGIIDLWTVLKNILENIRFCSNPMPTMCNLILQSLQIVNQYFKVI